MNRLIAVVRHACEWLGLVEPLDDPYVSRADGPPPSPDGLQPLPATLEDLHVPETQPYTCATCGGQHEAVLSTVTPLGAASSADDPKVELRYKAGPCPNAPTTPAEPLPADHPAAMLETTPRVVHDEEDGT